MNFATIGLSGLQGRVDSYLNKTYPAGLYLLPMFAGATLTALIAGNVLKYFIEPQVEKQNIHQESRKTAKTVCDLLAGVIAFTALKSSGTVRKVSFYSSLAFATAGLVVELEETKSNPWIKIATLTIPLALSEAWMRKYA